MQIGNESERLAALKSGGIDGSIFNAPFGSMAKKFNFNVLADAGALGIPYFNTGMCGSAKLIQKNEGRILNFLRAYVEAIRFFNRTGIYLEGGWRSSAGSTTRAFERAYDYNKIRSPTFLSVMSAMQAGSIRWLPRNRSWARSMRGICQRSLFEKLEEEGFVQKLMGLLG